jgi:hypothetical protein
MTMRWIWLVPSYIWVVVVSRALSCVKTQNLPLLTHKRHTTMPPIDSAR